MTARTPAPRHPAREAGQAALELVGYTFLVVLAAVLCVQGVFAAQAASAAQQAARDGARALSLGQDWRAVVDHTLPDWARAEAVERCPADAGTACVRVAVRVPIGVRSITSADIRFDRSAQMPIGG